MHMRMDTGENAEIVLCADVVYEPACYAPLVDTICALLGRRGCRGDGRRPRSRYCLMAHRTRHADAHAGFFELARRRLDLELLHGPPLPQPPAEAEAATVGAPPPAAGRELRATAARRLATEEGGGAHGPRPRRGRVGASPVHAGRRRRGPRPQA